MSLLSCAPWRGRKKGGGSQAMKPKQRSSAEGRYLVFDVSTGAVSVRLGDFLKSDKAKNQFKDMRELRRRALESKEKEQFDSESAAYDHSL